MSTVVGVVLFPGSNCEHDVMQAIESLGGSPRVAWHGDTALEGVDAVIVPGGFAHGDYLRPGALARFSPIMGPIGEFAAAGGPVLGICNGFQVLTEAGLLPGALMPNEGLRFICRTVACVVVQSGSVLTREATTGAVLRLPINHYEGNYNCDQATLKALEDNGQIVLRYEENPNGSLSSIAGVSNKTGNVVGLMPHPERAGDELLGSTDGSVLLRSFLAAARAA
jgi:phosphoribosylformylglycinamidine synthase